MTHSGYSNWTKSFIGFGLNPSFAGWPTLGIYLMYHSSFPRSLNPSFAGWPTLGSALRAERIPFMCLNPSFAGWPTLGNLLKWKLLLKLVLIPLLLDDPLWAKKCSRFQSISACLNPSFAGWPTLGDFVFLINFVIFSLNPSFAGWPTLGECLQKYSLEYRVS